MRISTRVSKTCPQCKVSFTVPRHREHTAIYCSRKCKALYDLITCVTQCGICGETFTHISSRCNKAKYCSRTCFYKSLKGRGSVEYTCKHCGTVFRDAPSHKRQYCSKACINKAKKEEWSPSYSFIRKVMKNRGMLVSCDRCGYCEHAEILGIHHKDRNPKNNAKENLEVLCPNCHSLEHMKHIVHGLGRGIAAS